MASVAAKRRGSRWVRLSIGLKVKSRVHQTLMKTVYPMVNPGCESSALERASRAQGTCEVFIRGTPTTGDGDIRQHQTVCYPRKMRSAGLRYQPMEDGEKIVDTHRIRSSQLLSSPQRWQCRKDQTAGLVEYYLVS